MAVSIALVGASAQAQGALRFNLTCSGKVTNWTDAGARTGVWTATARVDLSRNRLCLDDCLDIRGVSVDRSDTLESLSLGKEGPSPERVEFADKIDLDRRSGQFYRAHDWVEARGGEASYDFPIMHRDIYSGRCTLNQFTGFPARQF